MKVSKSGKEHRKKVVQKACDANKCKFKCTTKITEKQRLQIHSEFYQMADKLRHKKFIFKCMKVIPPSKYKQKANRKRNCNFSYNFHIMGKSVSVCKAIFKATLDVSNNTITTVQKKRMI